MASPLAARLARDRFFQLGLALVAVVVLAALLAPWLAPHDPYTGDLANAYLESPGGTYPLGTDTQGRDVLSRVLYGARISVAVGIISQTVAVMLGVTLGLLAGYLGGWWDRVLTTAADIGLAIPVLILTIVVLTVFDDMFWVAMVLLGVMMSPPVIRNVRGAVIAVRHENFVDAARVRQEVLEDELLQRVDRLVEHRERGRDGERHREERHERKQRGVSEAARSLEAALFVEAPEHRQAEVPEAPPGAFLHYPNHSDGDPGLVLQRRRLGEAHGGAHRLGNRARTGRRGTRAHGSPRQRRTDGCDAALLAARVGPTVRGAARP